MKSVVEICCSHVHPRRPRDHDPRRTIAPSFAFVGAGSTISGASQASDLPKVLVSGGARYHKLHNPRLGDREGGLQREAAPRNAVYGMRYVETFNAGTNS